MRYTDLAWKGGNRNTVANYIGLMAIWMGAMLAGCSERPKSPEEPVAQTGMPRTGDHVVPQIHGLHAANIDSQGCCTNQNGICATGSEVVLWLVDCYRTVDGKGVLRLRISNKGKVPIYVIKDLSPLSVDIIASPDCKIVHSRSRYHFADGPPKSYIVSIAPNDAYEIEYIFENIDDTSNKWYIDVDTRYGFSPDDFAMGKRRKLKEVSWGDFVENIRTNTTPRK